MSQTPHDVDEGYIKYDAEWLPGPAPDAVHVAELERWRSPLFEAGLIGHDEALNVGYGNLSVRAETPGQFVITGTQTGHLAETSGEHYALVTEVDIDANRVRSVGPIAASSEAMTHAALYALGANVAAVVHVHSRELWNRYRDVLPTTASDVAYGTPQMAREFGRLWRRTGFREAGIAVMAGHDDGLLSIGATLEEAAQRMLALSSAR